MNFTGPNWLSIIELYTWPLRHWLCVYFAIFPSLSTGCEPICNLPCANPHCETQIMVLKYPLALASTPALSSLLQNEAALTPPPPSSAPTTPPSKAVGRLPALG